MTSTKIICVIGITIIGSAVFLFSQKTNTTQDKGLLDLNPDWSDSIEIEFSQASSFVTRVNNEQILWSFNHQRNGYLYANLISTDTVQWSFPRLLASNPHAKDTSKMPIYEGQTIIAIHKSGFRAHIQLLRKTEEGAEFRWKVMPKY